MRLLIGILIGIAITFSAFFLYNKTHCIKATANKTTSDTAVSTAMNLNEPKNEKEQPILSVENPLTIFAYEDELFYANGKNCNNLKKTTLDNISKLLEIKKKEVNQGALMILIKGDKKTNFKTIIDLLDEMQLAAIPAGHYAEADITEDELICLKNNKQN